MSLALSLASLGAGQVSFADSVRGNYYVTSGLGVSALLLTLTPEPEVGRWHSGALFDDSVRNGLRASSWSGRSAADTASDWMLLSIAIAPLAIPAVNQGFRADPVHWAADAFLFNYVVTEGTKKLISRERPFQRECRSGVECDPAFEPYKSFVSGHSSTAFTAAGLLCSPGFREVAGIRSTGGGYYCGIGLGVAATVALLRVVADKHYSTDVLTGAAVGFSSGYFVPEWFRRDSSSGQVSPQMESQGLGLQYSLRF